MEVAVVKEPVVTYAVIYKVYHPRFPSNKKYDGDQVIEQRVTSAQDEVNDYTEMQAKRQVCGYAASRLGISVFPDDVKCVAKYVRTEKRVNGRRASAVVRTKRTKKAAATSVPPPKVASPPVIPAKPIKSQQTSLTF